MTPALITIAPSVALAVPGLTQTIIGMYTANIAARVAYDSVVGSSSGAIVAAIEEVSNVMHSNAEGVTIGESLLNIRDILRSANMIMQGEFEVWTPQILIAEMEAIQALDEQLQDMKERLESVLSKWRETPGGPVRVGIAEILDEKPCGMVEPHLHVNVIPPSEQQEYQESWTLYT